MCARAFARCLQDSLGGNSKTTIIANISPSSDSAHETQSTLAFAQRAKHMRNRAHVNTDTQGDVDVLRREINRLHQCAALFASRLRRWQMLSHLMSLDRGSLDQNCCQHSKHAPYA